MSQKKPLVSAIIEKRGQIQFRIRKSPIMLVLEPREGVIKRLMVISLHPNGVPDNMLFYCTLKDGRYVVRENRMPQSEVGYRWHDCLMRFLHFMRRRPKKFTKEQLRLQGLALQAMRNSKPLFDFLREERVPVEAS